MKSLLSATKCLALSTLFLSMTSQAIDILTTDKQFAAADYTSAKQGYLEAAEVGNPHAYYQLALMYHKGLGTQPDALNTLIYFSMAAEYDFRNAKKLVSDMMKNFSDEQVATIEGILEDYRLKNGMRTVSKKYMPSIIQENLNTKITFNGGPTQTTQFFADDVDLDDFSDTLGGGFTDDDGNEEGDDFFTPLSTPKIPFVIVENDVAADGSKRNLSKIQTSGLTTTMLEEYALYPGEKPEFKGQPVSFVNRVYMGAANYNKFTMIEENEPLYENIYRTVKKLKASPSLSDQYSYAVALQNFTWLAQEEGELEAKLLDLSKQGHPGAMFEYGSKLYREQTDISQAIEWISRASTYGLARAEYRLGTMLTDSPWVEYDEKKALFWYDSASKKDYEPAMMKAAELRLTAADESLRDLDAAITLLDKLEATQKTNPEYFYLLALSHKDRKNRDFTQVIKNLERAIFMGSNKNWDVNEWQELLSRLTQGNVTISDEG